MRLTDSVRGANAYLRSAFLAVLLAPVLPDIAVDLFGDTASPWLLRVLAVVGLFGGCVVLFAWTRHLERKLVAANQDPKLHKVERCDVLILGLGPRSEFRRLEDRNQSELSVPEYLVQHTHPSKVILVSTPQVAALDEIRRNLETERITVHRVTLSDAMDPDEALSEVPRQVTELLENEKLSDKKINVDVTSGTVVMSLAMVRLALILSAQVVYVWGRGLEGKPAARQSRSFDPRDVLPAVQ